MKNIIRGIKYFFGNFFIMFLFSLPIAVMFAVKYNNSFFYDYILNLSGMETSTIFKIYSHFSLLPEFEILKIVLWIIILLLCFCLMFSYTERHMKFGIKSFVKSFKSVNYSVLAVLPAFLTVMSFEELFSFLISLFIKLFGLSQNEIINILLPVVFVLFYMVLFLIYSIIALWVPIKMVTGYSNKDAIRYSIRLSQGKQFSIMFGIVFPIIVASPFMILLKIFSNIEFLNIAAYTLCYVFIIGYLVSYMMALYFDLSGLERKDIKKKII